MALPVSHGSTEKVGRDSQCLDFIIGPFLIGIVEEPDETPEGVPDEYREDYAGFASKQGKELLLGIGARPGGYGNHLAFVEQVLPA
jgi:hypothetical protein